MNVLLMEMYVFCEYCPAVFSTLRTEQKSFLNSIQQHLPNLWGDPWPSDRSNLCSKHHYQVCSDLRSRVMRHQDLSFVLKLGCPSHNEVWISVKLG